jgi:hypothetical protein
MRGRCRLRWGVLAVALGFVGAGLGMSACSPDDSIKGCSYPDWQMLCHRCSYPCSFPTAPDAGGISVPLSFEYEYDPCLLCGEHFESGSCDDILACLEEHPESDFWQYCGGGP